MHHREILDYLSYGMIGTSAVTFIALIFIPTPYGRNSSSKFGKLIPAKAAWLIQELPSFIIPFGYTASILSNHTSEFAVNKLSAIALLLPFTIHYFQRSLVFPLLIRGGKPTPLVPFLLALGFCSLNGYLQASSIANYGGAPADLTTAIGLIVFIAGMGINLHSDHVLRTLRRPGETGYKIPRGGLFALVSGANFFGEILEWWGFALAARSLPALAFAIFTTANTAPRAWHHHRWYLQKFGSDYPKERKALLPYLL